MNWFTALVAGGIVLIFLPVLAVGGIGVAIVLAILWLALTFGTKGGWEVFKERQSGATAAKYKSRSLTGDRDKGQRWDR